MTTRNFLLVLLEALALSAPCLAATLIQAGGQCGGAIGCPTGEACIDAAWSSSQCTTNLLCSRYSRWVWQCQPSTGLISTTPITTPAPAPTPTPSPSPTPSTTTRTITVEMYSQCGGKSSCPAATTCSDAAWPWATCVSGLTCQRSNEWYWQCSTATSTQPTGGAPTIDTTTYANGSFPAVPAAAVIEMVTEKINLPSCTSRLNGARSSAPIEYVLGDDGMPASGIASTSSFLDAPVSGTACGKKPSGTYAIWNGEVVKNFRNHGALAAMNMRWYKTQYNNQAPYNQRAQAYYTGSQTDSGYCNSHCYELTALVAGSGSDDIPHTPLVVMIGEECTDCGWCDALDDVPSTMTSGLHQEAGTNWKVNRRTNVHFDIMAGSLPEGCEWWGHSLNKPAVERNFLVQFKRVDCSLQTR